MKTATKPTERQVKAGESLLKMFKAEIKSVDTENKRVRATISTSSPDRDGDRVFPTGADLGPFLKHPVLLSSHGYGTLQNNIGKAITLTSNDSELEAEFEYFVGEGNPEADWGFKLAEKGMAAYSIGFMVKVAEYNPETFGFNILSWEMVEVSQVTVPANREALQKMKELGKTNTTVKEVLETADEIDNSDEPALEGYDKDDEEEETEEQPTVNPSPHTEKPEEEKGITMTLADLGIPEGVALDQETLDNMAKALSAKFGKPVTIKTSEDQPNSDNPEGEEAKPEAEGSNNQMPEGEESVPKMVFITDEDGEPVAKVAMQDLEQVMSFFRLADNGIGEGLKGFKAIKSQVEKYKQS